MEGQMPRGSRLLMWASWRAQKVVHMPEDTLAKSGLGKPRPQHRLLSWGENGSHRQTVPWRGRRVNAAREQRQTQPSGEADHRQQMPAERAVAIAERPSRTPGAALRAQ